MSRKIVTFLDVQPNVVELIRDYSEKCTEITVDQSQGGYYGSPIPPKEA